MQSLQSIFDRKPIGHKFAQTHYDFILQESKIDDLNTKIDALG